MWSELQEPEFEQFLSDPIPAAANAKGFVVPYGDCPLDGERVGEMVYMDMLNRARKYVHIITPYLILDGELVKATVAQQPYEMGYQVVEAAVKAVKGEAVDEVINAPVQVVTAENGQAYLDNLEAMKG